MIKILYLGKHYLDVIDKIPKGEEYVILDNEEYLKNGEKGFIKYVDDAEDIYKNNHNGVRIMIKKGIDYDKSLLRDYLVVSDFYKTLPPFKRIGLYGNKDMVVRFIKFLTNYYHCGFKITSGNWQKQYLIEESLINSISNYVSQIDLQRNGLIELVLDNSKTDINIFFWDGKLEDIYEWKGTNTSENNVLLTNRFFSLSKIRKKWKVRTYFVNKYNIKSVWKSICYYYNVL